MAKEDYNVADREVTALEAGDKVQETVQDTPDADAAAFAAAGNVSRPEYRNYATALNAYAARADIESLADRRARDHASDFADQDFMRAEVYDPTTGAVNSPPRAGSVEGDAPASA
jgi:hypothetical protein